MEYEFNKPVSNPMMVGSIELLKAEDTLNTDRCSWRSFRKQSSWLRS